ncbi:MAG: peptide deformylase [Bradymonadales bacterium]|nr:MAG: peptide deformylase [Bradymonadales bacterium]
MALLEIIDVPHPTLSKVAKPVLPEEIDDDLRRFIQDMIETMKEAPGVGLAAPQVNISKRILVVDLSSEDPKAEAFALINPEIIECSGEDQIEEGCLSIPEFNAKIPRSKKVRVKYLDEYGKEQVIENDGFLAIVLQHEIDHLNGITMLDHVSAMKRFMYLKKIKKRQRQEKFAYVKREP